MLKLIKPSSKSPLDAVVDLKYKLNRVIGEGYCVNVYSAFCAKNKPVAIKIPAEGADDEVSSPIKQEINALKALKHDHIVSILNQDENVPFIVTELLDGDLCHLVFSIREFGLSEQDRYQLAYHLLFPVAQALDYMHHRGYIHRDIKPENIFFRYKTFPPLPITCEIKIGDFGLVARIGDKPKNRIRSSQVIGTAPYLAPESAAAGYYSRASDTYSFGLLVYFLATLSMPYPSLAEIDIIRFVLPALSRGIALAELIEIQNQNSEQAHGMPEAVLVELSKNSLSPFWERMPPCLDRLANGCCEINPDNRITMTHVTDQLTELVQSHTVSSQALTRSALGFYHPATVSAREAANHENRRSASSRRGC